MPRGLILFAHGARDPEWGRPLLALAERIVVRDPDVRVRIAFLELQAPDLPAAIDELAPDCEEIAVLPVFWAAAGHVSKELPRLIEVARGKHRDLSFEVLPTLSELPGLLDYLAATVVSRSRAPHPSTSG